MPMKRLADNDGSDGASRGVLAPRVTDTRGASCDSSPGAYRARLVHRLARVTPRTYCHQVMHSTTIVRELWPHNLQMEPTPLAVWRLDRGAAHLNR